MIEQVTYTPYIYCLSCAIKVRSLTAIDALFSHPHSETEILGSLECIPHLMIESMNANIPDSYLLYFGAVLLDTDYQETLKDVFFHAFNIVRLDYMECLLRTFSVINSSSLLNSCWKKLFTHNPWKSHTNLPALVKFFLEQENLNVHYFISPFKDIIDLNMGRPEILSILFESRRFHFNHTIWLKHSKEINSKWPNLFESYIKNVKIYSQI